MKKRARVSIFLIIATMAINSVPFISTTNAAYTRVVDVSSDKDTKYDAVAADSTTFIAPYSNDIIKGTSIIKPDINYKANYADDGATVSAAQMVSFNDTVKSYMRFDEEITSKQPWYGSVNTAFTLVDWRLWNSSMTADVIDTIALIDENGSNLNNSKLTADADMARAINILGNDAFIPENVDFKTGQSYIHRISPETPISRTETLCALYKAMGNSHYLPPVVVFQNLDGKKDAVDKTMLKETSMASLPGAENYLYYSVYAKGARHCVYQSNNLIEGYLWDALQDGVVSIYDLKEDMREDLLQKYAKGIYAEPISPQNARMLPTNDTYKSPMHRSGTDTAFKNDPCIMMGYNIGYEGASQYIDNLSGNNVVSGNLKVRYQTPQVFNDENLTFLEFCVLAANVMHLRGEPVLTEQEERILTASYGSQLPSMMSDEYYDAVLYLTARGIIGDDYIEKGVYNSLTWKDVFVICSRIKDPNSRLTYKNVTIPFDLEMLDEGYMAVTPAVSDIVPEDIQVSDIAYTPKEADATSPTVYQEDEEGNVLYKPSVSKVTDGDFEETQVRSNLKVVKRLFVRKDPDATFKDSTGSEVFPIVSRNHSENNGSFGYCEKTLYYDNNNKAYYCINFYEDEEVPSDYNWWEWSKASNKWVRKSSDKTKLPTMNYRLYAKDCDTILYVENVETSANPNTGVMEAIYTYSTGAKMSIYTPTSVDGNIKREVQSITYLPTDTNTPSSDPNDQEEEQSGTKYVYKIVLPAGNKLSGYGDTKLNDFITITSVADIPTDWPDGAVYMQTSQRTDSSGTTVNSYKNGATVLYVLEAEDKNIDATIQNKLRYSAATTSNVPAYVKRDNQRDVYYGSSFLSKEYGIKLYKDGDEKEFNLVFNNQQSYKIKYSSRYGWIIYGNNVLLSFTDAIPPIKENTNEGSAEAYFIHGLLVDFYIRQQASSDKIQSYLTSDGYLHLTNPTNTSAGSWTLTPIKAAFKPIINPSHLSFKDSISSVYTLDNTKHDTYYLDLQTVPIEASNFILVWNISSATSVNAYVVNAVPKGAFTSNYVTDDMSKLNNLLQRADIKLPSDSGLSFSYYQAVDFANLNGFNTTVNNGYVMNKKLIYDPNNFICLWSVNEKETDGSVAKTLLLDDNNTKSVGLPYTVYYKGTSGTTQDIDIFFLNLAMDCTSSADLRYYMPSDSYADKILSTTATQGYMYNDTGHCVNGDVDVGDTLPKSFPVMLFSKIFAKESPFVKEVKDMTSLRNNTKMTDMWALLGNQYLNVKFDQNASTSDLKLQLQPTSTGLAQWIVQYWSTNPDYTDVSNQTVLAHDATFEGLIAVQSDDKWYLIDKFALDILNDTTDDSATDVKTSLALSVAESISDLVDMLYMSEKELNEKFADANGILALSYLVVTVLVPRFLFGFLFLMLILALIINNRILQWICRNFVDFFQVLSFGRANIDSINPVRLWVTGTVGCVAIILISRDYGIRTLTWIVSAILQVLQSIW